MKLSHKKVIVYTISTIVGVFLLSVGLAYFTLMRDPVTVLFKRLYPQAFIGSRLISLNDVEEAGIVASKFGLTEQEGQKVYFDYEKKIALAKNLKLTVKADAAADEERFYTKGNEGEYDKLLKSTYGNSERIFYKYLVYPQVTDAQLRIKYNNEVKSTSNAYKKAQTVLERLKKGEKFEELAKTESDDMTSGALGGDLGYYESGQLLPELEDQVSISALDEVRKDILVSRLGYHIVYPVEHSNIDGKKLWHVKHMLFVPDGFDAWLEQKLAPINITYLKK